jgi:hypothetical protein
MAEEHFRTGSKKGRGRAKASLDLIAAMHTAAEAAQPKAKAASAVRLQKTIGICFIPTSPSICRATCAT